MAIRYLSGQTIDGTLTVSGNIQAPTFNGLAINTTGTNNVANQIVRTQANGYVNFGWINSVSGNHTGSITRITASNDAYLRYVTPAQFRTGVTDGFYAPSSTVSGVTSVATGLGLTGGTITSTGTISLNRDTTQLGAVLATYGTTAGASGRVRCTAPFNTNSSKMFSIEVTLYTNYTQHNYVVSAYMYSTTNQWYSPKAIYTTTGTASPDIYVGRDGNGKAYISIANSSYTGVLVHNMTRGYTTSLANTYEPWTITIDGGNENSTSVAVSTVYTSANLPSGSGVTSVAVTAGTGISASVTNSTTTPNITITNTAPNIVQTSVTGGSGYLDTNRGTPSSAGQYWQASSLGTTEAPSTDWYNTWRGGHGHPLTYYSNTLAIKMTGTGPGTIYVQTISNGTALGWNKYWHDGNLPAGSGVTSVSYTHQGNAFTVGGVPVTSSGTIAVTMAGSSSQYINGAGNLISFPAIPPDPTGVYLPLAGGTMTGTLTAGSRIIIQPRNDNTNVGTINATNSQSDWQSLTNVSGQFTVTQYNAIQNYTNSPSGVYTYGSVLSTRTANHSFQLYSAHTGDLCYKTQWNNDNYSAWRGIPVYGANSGSPSTKDLYSTRVYDSDNTAYYLDPASTSVLNAATFASNITTSAYIISSNGNGRIILGGNFHIDAFNGNDIYVNYYSNRRFRVWNGSSNESFRVDTDRITYAYYQMRSPIYYDNDNTAFYADFASTTTSLSTAGKWVCQGGHSSARMQLNYQHSSTDLANSGTLTGWVSEPGITYNSAGIGGNINVNGQYYGRAYNSGYGCYVRFDKGNGNVEHWMTTGNAGTAGGQGTRLWYTDNAGNAFASLSSQAPTFYDLNDTSYYLNANSTSQLNVLNCAGTLTVTGSSGVVASKFTDYNNGSFYLDPSSTGTSLNVAGDVVAYASSDIRFKNNITPITNALNKINKIGGYTFEWNEISHKETGKKDIGVIAQEVEEILPEIVDTRDNGYKAVDYSKLTALLIQSVKEQQVIINDLKSRIETLENN